MNECCLCGSSVAMRTKYRTRYNIPVSDQPGACPTATAWGAQGRRKGCPRGGAEVGICTGRSQGHIWFTIVPAQTSSSQSLLDVSSRARASCPGLLPM